MKPSHCCLDGLSTGRDQGTELLQVQGIFLQRAIASVAIIRRLEIALKFGEDGSATSQNRS